MRKDARPLKRNTLGCAVSGREEESGGAAVERERRRCERSLEKGMDAVKMDLVTAR
jgi:hypothetical protein